jgi:hypothetical protein
MGMNLIAVTLSRYLLVVFARLVATSHQILKWYLPHVIVIVGGSENESKHEFSTVEYR